MQYRVIGIKASSRHYRTILGRMRAFRYDAANTWDVILSLTPSSDKSRAFGLTQGRASLYPLPLEGEG
jgi:hypothetical protein